MPTTFLTAEQAWTDEPESEFTRFFRTDADYVRAFRRLALGDQLCTPLPDPLEALAGRLEQH